MEQMCGSVKGNKVTLYEKEEELGGKLRTASTPSFKSVLRDLVKYLSAQLNKLQVKVEIGKEVTPELLDRVSPEVAVIATGANPLIPTIPGVENKNVTSAVDLHWSKKRAGENVLVAGGGLTGCDTALFLAQEGKKVTIVEMLPNVAFDLNPMSRPALLTCFQKTALASLPIQLSRNSLPREWSSSIKKES